ncbi:penicillin amidase [Ostertagia ostertagi]
MQSVDRFINYYKEDGGCEEGPAYWSHAGGMLFNYLTLLQQATGGAVNIFNRPLIRNIGAYIYKAHIDSSYYINYADAAAKLSTDAGIVYHFGKATNDRLLTGFGAYLARQQHWEKSIPVETIYGGIQNIFSAPSILAAKAQPAFLADAWMEGTGIAMARDAAGSAKGFYFSALAGHNANQHDLFFAQGYCAAKDRLFQLEIWRRQATGTMAAILGGRELQRDIGARLFRFRGNMDKELNHYHPQGKQIIQAFTEGINAYIDEVNRQPEQLPVEFRLLHILPGKWTPEVVISRHQGILGNITEELNMGRSVAMVGEKKIKELLWFHPDDPLLQIDSAINTVLLGQDILSLYNAWRKDLLFTPEDSSMIAGRNAATTVSNEMTATQGKNMPSSPEMEGSNNWVIAGSRTASGHTMLANDPHRKIALPSLRYIVHLNAPGWNVTGGGEPEIPGVAIGHNEEGAWGITVHQTDAEDLYIYDLRPGHLDQYRYKGEWLQMKALQDTITIKVDWYRCPEMAGMSGRVVCPLKSGRTSAILPVVFLPVPTKI